MIEAEDLFAVPWDSLWDDAIERQIEAGGLGRVGDARGPAVLYRPGRLLVDARASAEGDVQSTLSAAGARSPLVAESEVAERLGLRVFEADDDRRLIDALGEINRFAAGSASLDHVLIGGPARWGGDSLPVPIADPGTVPGRDAALGQGITVAVLDTGIAAVPFAVDAGPGDAEIPDEDGDERRDPPAGHGTHVAGLVASVAGGARIVARRTLTGVVGVASELAVAEALLASSDADIINCSFSGATLTDAPPVAIERALALLSPRTVVVACAGNLGTDRPQWPAAAKGVIAVGAIGRERDGEAWRPTDFTNHGRWVDCCAPGVEVPSTFLRYEGFDGFASWTGTSMSCPQVAGAIAAIAARDGIEPGLAAYRLVHDPAHPRIAQLGAIVDPANLP
jgi:subtilisin family serine protease